jgi:hypothetical protein
LNKEDRWTIGLLFIGLGGILLFIFLLCSERFEFLITLSNPSIYNPQGFSPVTNLINYTPFFLISGLITPIIGFLFNMILLYQNKDLKVNPEIKSKIRITLIIVSFLYIAIIGYLMTINYEWETDPLIIHLYDYLSWFNHPPHLSYPLYPVYAFYQGFIITSFYAFFSSVLLFGIFILPFIIAETGILDNISDEQTNNLRQDNEVQKAEDQFERFSGFIKRNLSSLMKMKYFKIIMIFLIVFGLCLSILPFFFVSDGPWVHQDYDISEQITYSKFPFYLEDPEAPLVGWFVEDYRGYLRGQLLLIGFALVLLGIILIIYHVYRKRKLII